MMKIFPLMYFKKKKKKEELLYCETETLLITDSFPCFMQPWYQHFLSTLNVKLINYVILLI